EKAKQNHMLKNSEQQDGAPPFPVQESVNTQEWCIQKEFTLPDKETTDFINVSFTERQQSDFCFLLIHFRHDSEFSLEFTSNHSENGCRDAYMVVMETGYAAYNVCIHSNQGDSSLNNQSRLSSVNAANNNSTFYNYSYIDQSLRTSSNYYHSNHHELPSNKNKMHHLKLTPVLSESNTVNISIRYTIIQKDIKQCKNDIIAQAFETGIIESPNFGHEPSPDNFKCVTTIRAPEGHRIQLLFNSTFELEDSPSCTNDYLHIGNDITRIGEPSMTSYKFCGSASPIEVVSRGEVLWIVFNTNYAKTFQGYQALYSILLPVSCNKSDFHCSDVQCVHPDRVCDGVQDCSNNRDEYCGLTTSQEEPCFMCKDGACIKPRLLRYSVDWGRSYWWLCDGFKHCSDGTDERYDVCLRLDGRSNALMQCQPANHNPSQDFNVLILKLFRCNGKKDCYNGEDEMCEEKIPEKWLIKPEFVCVPIGAMVLVALVMTAIYCMSKRNRKPPLPRYRLNSSQQSGPCDQTQALQGTEQLNNKDKYDSLYKPEILERKHPQSKLPICQSDPESSLKFIESNSKPLTKENSL
ncbi:unnamed protein product, partial [Owenia fusiformis]